MSNLKDFSTTRGLQFLWQHSAWSGWSAVPLLKLISCTNSFNDIKSCNGFKDTVKVSSSCSIASPILEAMCCENLLLLRTDSCVYMVNLPPASSNSHTICVQCFVLLADGTWGTRDVGDQEIYLHSLSGSSDSSESSTSSISSSPFDLKDGSRSSSAYCSCADPMRPLFAARISHVSCGSTHVLACVDEGRLFSWGSNGFGQLGTGDNRDREVPTLVRPMVDSNALQLYWKESEGFKQREDLFGVQIPKSKEPDDSLHDLFVTKVFCGHFTSFCLGKLRQEHNDDDGSAEKSTEQIRVQSLLKQIQQDHLYLMGWGSNETDQVGSVVPHIISTTPSSSTVAGIEGSQPHDLIEEQGETSKDVLLPCLIFPPSSKCSYHIFSNRKPIPFFPYWSFLSCGYGHTLAVSSWGRLYGWGTNLQGQLGLAYLCERVTEPHHVQLFDSIGVRHISCGTWSSLVVSNEGQVFSAGRTPQTSSITGRELIEEQKVEDTNLWLANTRPKPVPWQRQRTMKRPLSDYDGHSKVKGKAMKIQLQNGSSEGGPDSGVAISAPPSYDLTAPSYFSVLHTFRSLRFSREHCPILMSNGVWSSSRLHRFSFYNKSDSGSEESSETPFTSSPAAPDSPSSYTASPRCSAAHPARIQPCGTSLTSSSARCPLSIASDSWDLVMKLPASIHCISAGSSFSAAIGRDLLGIHQDESLHESIEPQSLLVWGAYPPFPFTEQSMLTEPPHPVNGGPQKGPRDIENNNTSTERIQEDASVCEDNKQVPAGLPDGQDVRDYLMGREGSFWPGEVVGCHAAPTRLLVWGM